jgi:WD40 repeat protein
VLASETGMTVFVYDVTTGALVVKLTGKTTDASGVAVLSDASFVNGTTYRLVFVLASGAEGMDSLVA